MISVDANGDLHLGGRIVAHDDEIVRWLERRERRKRKMTNIVAPASGQHGVGHQSPCFCHTEMASYAGNQQK